MIFFYYRYLIFPFWRSIIGSFMINDHRRSLNRDLSNPRRIIFKLIVIFFNIILRDCCNFILIPFFLAWFFFEKNFDIDFEIRWIILVNNRGKDFLSVQTKIFHFHNIVEIGFAKYAEWIIHYGDKIYTRSLKRNIFRHKRCPVLYTRNNIPPSIYLRKFQRGILICHN